MSSITNNTNKVRIPWVDFSKGICMLFVIIHHCDVTAFEPLRPYYDPFVLTLFFLMSGFLFKPCNDTSGNKYFALFYKIFKSLIIPYICFCIIRAIIGFSFVESIMNGGWVAYLKFQLYQIIDGKLLWFIPCLVVVQLIYGILELSFLNRYKWAKYILTLLCLLSICLINHSEPFSLPWNVDTAFYAMGFFMLGSIIHDTKITDHITINGASKAISLTLLIVYIVIAHYANIQINMYYNIYGNMPLITLVVSLLGCVVIVYFSMNFCFSKYLRLLGRYSLVVFCIHGKGYPIFDRLMPLITFNLQKLFPFIYYLIYVLIIGAFCILIAFLIEQYFPFIIGKSKKAK